MSRKKFIQLVINKGGTGLTTKEIFIYITDNLQKHTEQ